MAALTKQRIGGHLLRELSVAVPCDPRTLKKALDGGRVSTLRLVAIRRTLEARGLDDLLPQRRDAHAQRRRR